MDFCFIKKSHHTRNVVHTLMESKNISCIQLGWFPEMNIESALQHTIFLANHDKYHLEVVSPIWKYSRKALEELHSTASFVHDKTSHRDVWWASMLYTQTVSKIDLLCNVVDYIVYHAMLDS